MNTGILLVVAAVSMFLQRYVWSWDKTRLLVGEGGVEEWEIVPRDWEQDMA